MPICNNICMYEDRDEFSFLYWVNIPRRVDENENSLSKSNDSYDQEEYSIARSLAPAAPPSFTMFGKNECSKEWNSIFHTPSAEAKLWQIPNTRTMMMITHIPNMNIECMHPQISPEPRTGRRKKEGAELCCTHHPSSSSAAQINSPPPPPSISSRKQPSLRLHLCKIGRRDSSLVSTGLNYLLLPPHHHRSE
jgi:hypothetical protein